MQFVALGFRIIFLKAFLFLFFFFSREIFLRSVEWNGARRIIRRSNCGNLNSLSIIIIRIVRVGRVFLRVHSCKFLCCSNFLRIYVLNIHVKNMEYLFKYSFEDRIEKFISFRSIKYSISYNE